MRATYDWPLVTQRQLEREIVKSPRIVKRALAARWITPIVQGGLGRRSLFLPSSIDALIERLQREVPPLMPCEAKRSTTAKEVAK
jgi:hypothetical protein